MMRGGWWDEVGVRMSLVQGTCTCGASRQRDGGVYYYCIARVSDSDISAKFLRATQQTANSNNVGGRNEQGVRGAVSLVNSSWMT